MASKKMMDFVSAWATDRRWGWALGVGATAAEAIANTPTKPALTGTLAELAASAAYPEDLPYTEVLFLDGHRVVDSPDFADVDSLLCDVLSDVLAGTRHRGRLTVRIEIADDLPDSHSD